MPPKTTGRHTAYTEVPAGTLASFVERKTTLDGYAVVSITADRWAQDGDGWVSTHYTVLLRRA